MFSETRRFRCRYTCKVIYCAIPKATEFICIYEQCSHGQSSIVCEGCAGLGCWLFTWNGAYVQITRDWRRPCHTRRSRIHRGGGLDGGCNSVGGSKEHGAYCNINTTGLGVAALLAHNEICDLCAQSNFYSTLVTMKDERDLPIFEVLEARAACEECIAKLDDPSQCPHMQLERPKWYTCCWLRTPSSVVICTGRVRRSNR